MMTMTVKCPYCQTTIEAEIRFLQTASKLCCMSCNKSFDISMKETQSEEDDMANESYNYDDMEDL